MSVLVILGINFTFPVVGNPILSCLPASQAVCFGVISSPSLIPHFTFNLHVAPCDPGGLRQKPPWRDEAAILEGLRLK